MVASSVSILFNLVGYRNTRTWRSASVFPRCQHRVMNGMGYDFVAGTVRVLNNSRQPVSEGSHYPATTPHPAIAGGVGFVSS